MSHRGRFWMYLISCLPVGAMLLVGLVSLPSFGNYRGPYGDLVIGTVIEKRNIPQGVAAVNFDYRGFDTLGEEFILFTAVAGALLLLRPQQQERRQEAKDRAADRNVPRVNDALHAAGTVMFPVALLLGIAILLHGHLTPGGGFQGGVMIASAFYFIYLSGEFEDFSVFTPDHALDLLEACGAGAFALVACLPLLAGLPFMFNVLPLGTMGDLLSGGNIPLFNCAVGLEVASAFLLLITSFLRQALILRRGKK